MVDNTTRPERAYLLVQTIFFLDRQTGDPVRGILLHVAFPYYYLHATSWSDNLVKYIVPQSKQLPDHFIALACQPIHTSAVSKSVIRQALIRL